MKYDRTGNILERASARVGSGPRDPAKFAVTGAADGVLMKVIVAPAGEGIITAHPC
jgi:hypothetical protein